MKHKVVFSFFTNDHEYNMGIGFISAWLKQHDVAVDLVIYREIAGKQTDTAEQIAAAILAKEPTIVAFSVMTFNWHRIARVITVLRAENYRGLIVVGGYHAILAYEEVMQHPGVDAVCTGEGEQPMLELTQRYDGISPASCGSIPGLLFTGAPVADKAAPVRWMVDPLEAYPYMDYDIFDAENSAGLARKFIGSLSPAPLFSMAVITGRGCPYSCTYCSNSALIDYYGGVKKFLRKYPVNSVLAHIKTLTDRYHPQFIEFLDETFTLDNTWVQQFCAGYKQQIGLPFSIMSRIDRLDESIVATLADSGLKLVFFGLESGDEEYRKNYLNRHMHNQTVLEGARLLKKYGIMMVTFNIFGMPFETRETVSKTFEMNALLDPDVAMPFVYQVFPRTKLAELAYAHNMVAALPQGRWDYCTPVLDTPELPAGEVAATVHRFRETFSNMEKVSSLYGRLRQASAQMMESRHAD